MQTIDLALPENAARYVQDHSVKVWDARYGWRFIAFHGGFTRENMPVPMTLNEAIRMRRDWGGKVVRI